MLKAKKIKEIIYILGLITLWIFFLDKAIDALIFEGDKYERMIPEAQRR
jgi:hypothetical protein